jgi:hypothetical protein
MAINVSRPYKLGNKKHIIEAYLYGEITQAEAAKAFGVKRQNFPGIIATMVRHMVKEDLINISKALKHY